MRIRSRRAVRALAGLIFPGFGVAGAGAAEPASGRVIADKTLVAWVSPASLTQRGGGVLTLENPGGAFDAIVFGEIAAGRWMPGSESFRRTHRPQEGWPAETAASGTSVQIAIVYRGRDVAVYRNGTPYARYTMAGEPVAFSTASFVLLGLRHRKAGDPGSFFGTIDDARIYDRALDAAAIAALRPDEPSTPPPLAWWDFERGRPEDRMGTFPAGRLVGRAKIVDGRLDLDGGYMVVGDARSPLRGGGQLVFEDRFEGRLDAGWTWLREHPTFHRIRNGALEIRVEPGRADTVRNALVRPAPDRRQGRFAVEVTVTSLTRPTQQWEQAGLTWYVDGKPVFKLVKEWIDGELFIIPGRRPMAAERVRLRLVVAGRRWIAQYQPDGRGPFRTAATGELPPPGRDEISIQCYNGPPDAAHWIRFDDFRILRLAD